MIDLFGSNLVDLANQLLSCSASTKLFKKNEAQEDVIL